MRSDGRGDLTRIKDVAHDDVSRRLDDSAPIANRAFLEAIERMQDRSLSDLQEAADAAQAAFRSWVEDPANSDRAFIECPAYVDRIAAESILERRLFTE